MNVKNLSIFFASSIFLSGCSVLGTKPLEFACKPEERPILNLEDPKSILPKDVKWFVITPENYEDVFKDLESKKYDLVLFGLTDEGYENLSLNLSELRKYIMEQKKIIAAYKEYYESHK